MSESINAAQLASRKIKSAKGVRGKLGNRVISNTGVPGVNGTQPFQGPDASSGGNLFGGGLNATGTFNFSAPVQGISFGDKPHISTTDWGSDGVADEDHRSGAVAEEAERRNKPFRAPDSSGTASPQPFSTTFQRTPLSALGQPNGMSSVPDAAKPNPFQISRSQSPAVVPPFNFGASAPQAQPVSSNIFSFGQNSQPSAGNSTFRFGTPPAVQDEPTINNFPFSQAPSQTEHLPSSSGFGLTTTASTTKPAGSIFSFGKTSTHTQQPSTSAIDFNTPPATVNIFGASNTSNSVPTLGLFGQSNQQPASSSKIFSNQTSMTNPTNGIFGNQSQSTVSSTSLFGEQQPKPASANPFGGAFNQQNFSPGNIFGNTNQAPQPASNLFGTFKPQQSLSDGVLGAPKEQMPASMQPSAQKQQPAPASNPFTAKPDNSAHTSHLFGAKNGISASAGTMFGSETKQPPATDSLFSTQQPQNVSTDNLFGAPKGSETSSESQLKTSLSNFPNALSAPTSNIFGNQAPQPIAATNIFANLNKPVDEVTKGSADLEAGSSFNESEADSVLPSIEGEGSTVDDAILERLVNEASSQRNGDNLFSSTKSNEAAESFANTSSLTDTNMPNGSSSPMKISSSRTTGPVHVAPVSDSNTSVNRQNYKIEMGEVSDSIINEKCPTHFTHEQRVQFFTAYRLRSLNKGIKQYIDQAELGADFSPSFHHYIERRGEILGACKAGLNNLERRHDEVQGETDTEQSSPKKRSKYSEASGPVQHMPRKSSPLKTQPVMNNIQSDKPISLEKQANPEARHSSMSPTKRAQHSFIGSTTPKAPPPLKPLFPNSQDSGPVSPSPRGKRKAEVQIDKDHPTEEEALGASHSSKWHPGNENKPSSVTSGVFKSILDSPGQPSLGSPKKRMFSLSETQSAEKPRFNPFAALPVPHDSLLGTSSSTTSEIASSGYQGQTLASKTGTQATSLFLAKPTESKSFSAIPEGPGTGQTSSNVSTSGPGALAPNPFSANIPSTFGAKSSAPISNSSAIKEGSTTSGIFSAKPSSASTDLSSVTPSANPTPFNPFAPKTTSAGTTSASSSDVEAKGVKPPTFGNAPVNFLAQFGQKSKKSMADAEAEALERAKEEDMDSDEDEAEWEAKYKEKRAAEKRATEELAKSKRATFVPGKGFTFDKVQQTSDDGKPTVKSIFSQTSAPAPFGPNLFASINRSQASSPGAISSRASSVFDGLGPPKPATFGGHNIFGHLSDVDSGADSGKGNDADDDTTDGETSNSNDEQDDEKKDTTSYPSEEDVPAPAPESPGTPVEETGSGIASTKKPIATLNLNSSNSGASTPASGGSLFDRISKDPKGNPIRQMPADSKENSSIGTTSIFGGNTGKPFAGFGQMASTDTTKQDNTWKPDSPIRFGASTTSPPTVNVTAPTPTKPTNFTGLFGSNAPPTPTGSPFGVFGTSGSAKPSSPASFTGIFGNNGPAKPTSGLFAHLSDTKTAPVGFGFGSTAGSSLLPSTAGSTATSRATSPGGTTDGESNNENIDPEAERHEQIDLTTGGPGEENEEVLHQVRAKALKFEPSKDTGKTDWVVKGLGPLRVLKNKETGASRVLLRADPSGTIVLNKGILENANYTATGKTVKLLTAGDGGQGLETWLLQVKTPAGAEELASVLEDKKRKS